MKFVRFFITLILLATGAEVRAQTVESVLRALQQRLDMLESSGAWYSVSQNGWSGSEHSFPPFPEDGTIQSLPDAIAVLRSASYWFDMIKYSFVAFDPSDRPHCVVTMPGAQGLDSLSLPSVGDINENNWKEKLRLLASNVDQLKCLEWWQVQEERIASYHWRGSHTQSEPPGFWPFDYGTDFYLAPDYDDRRSITYSLPRTQEFALRADGYGVGVSMDGDETLVAGEQWLGTIGVSASMITSEEQHPKEEKMFLLKDVLRPPWDDSTENYCKQSGGKIAFNYLVPLPPVLSSNGTFQTGEPASDTDWVDSEGPIDRIFDFLDVPSFRPDSWGYEEIPTSSDESWTITALDSPLTERQGCGQDLFIYYHAVVAPNFTPCLPALAKKGAL